MALDAPAMSTWGQQLLKKVTDNTCNTNTQFLCDTGPCIPITSACNGRIDCTKDGSDEDIKYCKAMDCCYETFQNLSRSNLDEPVNKNYQCISAAGNSGNEDSYVCLAQPEELSNTPVIGSIAAGVVFLIGVISLAAFVVVKKIKLVSKCK